MGSFIQMPRAEFGFIVLLFTMEIPCLYGSSVTLGQISRDEYQPLDRFVFSLFYFICFQSTNICATVELEQPKFLISTEGYLTGLFF